MELTATHSRCALLCGDPVCLCCQTSNFLLFRLRRTAAPCRPMSPSLGAAEVPARAHAPSCGSLLPSSSSCSLWFLCRLLVFSVFPVHRRGEVLHLRWMELLMEQSSRILGGLPCCFGHRRFWKRVLHRRTSSLLGSPLLCVLATSLSVCFFFFGEA